MRLLTNGQDNTEPRYEVTVRAPTGEETCYRTIKLLSAAATAHLLGKGTRVWKAVRLVDGEPTGDPVVLKDSWVDEDRRREEKFKKAWEAMLTQSLDGAAFEDEGADGGAAGKDKGKAKAKDGPSAGASPPADDFQAGIKRAMDKLKESNATMSVRAVFHSA